jgi:hypothetical protein
MKGLLGRSSWLLPLTLLLATGCAPTLQSNHNDLIGRAKQLRNIAMLPPDTAISELSAGSVKEKRDDWSASGRSNVERAIIENLQGKQVNVKVLRLAPDQEHEVDEITTLHRAVIGSVYSHAYFWGGQNPNFFPDRLKNFDYSVGPLDRLLKKQKFDGLLLVHARDEISSAGRKALRVVQAINPFGAAEQSGITTVEISLVDRKGDILWNTFFSESGGYDLRDFDSTRKFIKTLLEEFPAEGK